MTNVKPENLFAIDKKTNNKIDSIKLQQACNAAMGQEPADGLVAMRQRQEKSGLLINVIAAVCEIA